jgi:hypothetical protein
LWSLFMLWHLWATSSFCSFLFWSNQAIVGEDCTKELTIIGRAFSHNNLRFPSGSAGYVLSYAALNALVCLQSYRMILRRLKRGNITRKCIEPYQHSQSTMSDTFGFIFSSHCDL